MKSSFWLLLTLQEIASSYLVSSRLLLYGKEDVSRQGSSMQEDLTADTWRAKDGSHDREHCAACRERCHKETFEDTSVFILRMCGPQIASSRSLTNSLNSLHWCEGANVFFNFLAYSFCEKLVMFANCFMFKSWSVLMHIGKVILHFHLKSLCGDLVGTENICSYFQIC